MPTRIIQFPILYCIQVRHIWTKTARVVCHENKNNKQTYKDTISVLYAYSCSPWQSRYAVAPPFERLYDRGHKRRLWAGCCHWL